MSGGNDVGVIIAIAASSTGIIAVVLSMLFWIRTEANADRRHLDEKCGDNGAEIARLERRLEKLLRNRR